MHAGYWVGASGLFLSALQPLLFSRSNGLTVPSPIWTSGPAQRCEVGIAYSLVKETPVKPREEEKGARKGEVKKEREKPE